MAICGRHRFSRLALSAVLAATALAPAAGQARWTLPRTPDGRPDLQGIWTNETITPVERPVEFKTLVLNEEEAARLENVVADRTDRLAQPSDPNRTAPPKGGDGSTGAAGNVGGYNNFWLDAGSRVATINGERRSSLVVDPANGRIPPQTEQARKRTLARMAVNRDRGGEYDHPEFRPLAERCLLSFGSSAGPPMLPNYFYNNNYQIVQTPDQVMILVEMVHDVRVIRLNAKEHPPKHIRPWMGDSIGRWEGDTLVVETTNFHPLQVFRGASENLRVIERFTRVGEKALLYAFTIDDPTTFTAQWSGEVPFTKTDEVIYEYACHEGNYALSNILSGERDRERRKSQNPTQKEK